MDKEKKDQLFVTVVILGTLGVVATNIVSKDVNFLILGIDAASFILVMYFIFYRPSCFIKEPIEKLKKWKNKPDPKNIRLEKEILRNGAIVFCIRNNEFRRPTMYISKAQISDGHSTSFPLEIKHSDPKNK
jgi:hypothetical protein